MATFLSESYPKPKLMESRFINKIIKEQNNKITFEKKAMSYTKIFIIQYWKIIIGLLFIISLFYFYIFIIYYNHKSSFLNWLT